MTVTPLQTIALNTICAGVAKIPGTCPVARKNAGNALLVDKRTKPRIEEVIRHFFKKNGVAVETSAPHPFAHSNHNRHAFAVAQRCNEPLSFDIIAYMLIKPQSFTDQLAYESFILGRPGSENFYTDRESIVELEQAFQKGPSDFYRIGGDLLGFERSGQDRGAQQCSTTKDEGTPVFESFSGYIDRIDAENAYLVLDDTKGRRSYMQARITDLGFPEVSEGTELRIDIRRRGCDALVEFHKLPQRPITPDEIRTMRDRAEAALGDDWDDGS